MSNYFEYKGYSTRIHYSADDQVLYGKIEGISDYIDFESESAAEIEEEFHHAVDEYLVYCESIGKKPEKEFKGTFNVRIDPQIHRELYMHAIKYDVSLNQLIQMACKKFCEDIRQSETIHLPLDEAVKYGAVVSTLSSLQPLMQLSQFVSSSGQPHLMH